MTRYRPRWSSRSSRPRLERGASDRARPRTACVSSRSPSASTRGSVFRTRSLPKSEVSPPSPVRVATRADTRRGRAGTLDSLAAPVTLCSTSPAQLPAGLMEGPMPTGRGEAKDKNRKKKSKEQFGKGSIMKLGANAGEKIDAISTGSLAVDMALGVGGFPRGRVIEIFGPEASGKTTLALHAVASAQRTGGTAAFIDAEHALDAAWARTCGVSTDDLLISQPDNGQQALEIADTLVRSGAVDIVVIDSVAALVPREEIEGEMGDSFMGLQARLMSQALRKLTGSISKTKTTVIFINQLREKIGVMFGCFSYSTRVSLADGTQAKIGQIVNQKRSVEVLTADLGTGEVRPGKVVNWFNNGPTKDFLAVTVHKPSGNGRAQFSATPDHQVFTPEGFAPLRELASGDPVMVAQTRLLSDFQLDVIRGSLL